MQLICGEKLRMSSNSIRGANSDRIWSSVNCFSQGRFGSGTFQKHSITGKQKKKNKNNTSPSEPTTNLRIRVLKGVTLNN